MSKVVVKEDSFKVGELSPRLDARTDLEFYNSGAKILRNVIVKPQGGVVKRAGTEYIYSVGTAPPPAPVENYMWEECGTIGNRIDTWIYNTSTTNSYNVLHVIDDIYLIVYGGSQARLCTFTVSEEGDLPSAFIEEWQASDFTQGFLSQNLIKISETPGIKSTFLAVTGAYMTYVFKAFTFSVDTTGALTEIDYYEYNLISEVIYPGNMTQVFNPISDIYAVNTTAGIFTFRVSDAGIIEETDFVKDYVHHYPGGLAQFGLSGFCIPSINGIFPRYYYASEDTYELRSYSVDASGGITYRDTMTLLDHDYDIEFVDGNPAGFSGFMWIQAVRTDTGPGTYTLHLHVHTVPLNGYNFGAEFDSTILTPITGYWMGFPKAIWMGGQGYLVIYKYGTSYYTYIGASTWFVKTTGELSDQLDSENLNNNIWDGPATFPYPVYVEGSDGIYLNGNSNIVNAYGVLYTTNIYGETYCIPRGNCDKYNYR